MRYLNKIVLHCVTGDRTRIPALVEEFIRDGVIYVGVVGLDCALVEEIIDEAVVGFGEREYDMLTSSHPGESLEEVCEFARSLTYEFAGEIQIVEA